MLLGLVVFGMGIIRSFFSPERTRAVLAGKREGFGNIAAAGLGVVTPFCSCSAVPLFVGFISAGVPLGVALSFLISAPMVNEVALGLLFALVGWKVAAIYLGFGMAVAIVSGWVIGRLNLEDWLEEWVRNVRTGKTELPTDHQTIVDRIRAGLDAVRDIVGRVWIWMIVGIASAPSSTATRQPTCSPRSWARAHWWSVPAVVLIARSDLLQRRRHHPRGRGPARQGRAARHRACLHDERDRASRSRKWSSCAKCSRRA